MDTMATSADSSSSTGKGFDKTSLEEKSQAAAVSGQLLSWGESVYVCVYI